MRSSENRYIHADFTVGYLYHEGKYIQQDILKSIHYYKEASSFNNQYAKNNLGIIYKNGFRDKIPKNVAYAMEYFEEAIRQKNDPIAMYNLAHIYFYEEGIEESVDKPIQYLLKSFELSFYPSIILLLIILFKKYGTCIEDIKNKLSQYTKNIREYSFLFSLIEFLSVSSNYELFYQEQKNIDFLYNQSFEGIISIELFKKEEKPINTTRLDLTPDFYEGFGIF